MKAERGLLENRAMGGRRGRGWLGMKMIKIHNMQVLKCHNESHSANQIKVKLMWNLETRQWPFNVMPMCFLNISATGYVILLGLQLLDLNKSQLRTGSCVYVQGQPWTTIFLACATTPSLVIEMGFHELFSKLPWTSIFQSSNSQVEGLAVWTTESGQYKSVLDGWKYSWVEGSDPSYQCCSEVIGSWGANLIIGLIYWWVHSWWTITKWGFLRVCLGKGHSSSLYLSLCLSLCLSLHPLTLPAGHHGVSSFAHMLSAMMFLKATVLKAMEPAHHRMKLWAKINLPFQLFLKVILLPWQKKPDYRVKWELKKWKQKV
jgi:hypothetical protein